MGDQNKVSARIIVVVLHRKLVVFNCEATISNGMKSTLYWPKRKKRKKKHGFLARSKSRYGRRVLSKRRRKSRKRLTV